MNKTRIKVSFFMGVIFLGLCLASCTTNNVPTQAHPESGYEGGFGGDGEHKHQNKYD